MGASRFVYRRHERVEKTAPLYQFWQITPREPGVCTARSDRMPRIPRPCTRSENSCRYNPRAVPRANTAVAPARYRGPVFSARIASCGTPPRFSRRVGGAADTRPGFSRHRSESVVQTPSSLDLGPGTWHKGRYFSTWLRDVARGHGLLAVTRQGRSPADRDRGPPQSSPAQYPQPVSCPTQGESRAGARHRCSRPEG